MVVTKDTWLPEYDELDHEEIRLSSPALKAGAVYFGKYCDDVCKEFMLCRAEEQDPRRCLNEGKDVTACGLEFFRKVKQHCYEPFEKQWSCLENKSPDLGFKHCRKSQHLLDDCMKTRLGMEKPPVGYFAQVRVHDSTTRPRPPKMAIREYEQVPKMPKDYPQPPATHGSRFFFWP